MRSNHHATILPEEAELLANVRYDGDLFVLRLHAPQIAANALPGQFVHLRVSPERAMRRPISILLTHDDGRVDLLVKAVGAGTRLLRERKVGEKISLLGPIGKPFDLTDTNRRYLLMGGGVGIPPMIFAADRLRGRAEALLFAGSEVPFPFALRPSDFLLPGIEGNAILGLELLESWGVPSRLATKAGFYGCFAGYVADLASSYLAALPDEERKRCLILACGPELMLKSVARVGRQFGLPVQLSLEEQMACGVGGCAGCVVETVEQGKRYYRRVCVDGPVFPAEMLPDYATC